MNKKIKYILILAWIGIFVIAAVIIIHHQISIDQNTPLKLVAFFKKYKLAALIFILVFIARCLFFLPPWWSLTVSAGIVFPIEKAVLYVMIGTMLGSFFSFELSKYLGESVLNSSSDTRKFFKTHRKQLEENGFFTLICLRQFFHFDLLNILAAISMMRRKDFYWGTFWGILPSTILYVLLGSAAAEYVVYLFLPFVILILLSWGKSLFLWLLGRINK